MNNLGFTAYYMTVCLAATYENGKGAVMVADKMTTYERDGLPDLSVERDDVTKIFRVNDTTAILISGSRDFALELIRTCEKRLKYIKHPEKVAAYLLKRSTALQKQHAFHEILSPLGFRSYDHYNATQLQDRDRVSYNRQLHAYPFNVHTLVVGRGDKGKYEVYSFMYGTVAPSPSGFNIIGSGMAHSLQIVANEYHQSMTRDEVQNVLTRAKKEAENVSDVGVRTDIEYLP